MIPYYQPINVPNLSVISKQIDRALPDLVTGKFTLKEVYSINLIEIHLLKKFAPALNDWLFSIGLDQHLSYAALPWAAPHSKGPIHSDGKCIEAINLPVYNCEQGEMIWFDAEKMGDITAVPSNNSAKSQIAEFIPYKHNGAKELARVSSQIPAWVNTKIPHRGINFSDRPRIIITLRFDCPIDLKKILA